ncbi:prolipoprotein diacylglyceryl transferase family protein [Aggregatilineales bacterium SYSU G02658]
MSFYSNLLNVTVLGLCLSILWTAPREQRARVADALIVGLMAALLLGRALHVVLHWAYFQDHLAEIPQLRAGGLSWQGAAWGALIGCGLMSWQRGARWAGLYTGLALAAPLIGWAAWVGCQQALCAHGAEVNTLAEHPTWLVVEARDRFGLYAPRYHTHLLGASGMVGVGVVMLAARRRLPPPALLGLSLIGVAACSLLVGFLRGDIVPFVAGLRADQWLDLAVMLTGAALIIAHKRLMISSV